MELILQVLKKTKDTDDNDDVDDNKNDVKPLGAGNTHTHNCVDPDAENLNRLRKSFRYEIDKLDTTTTTLQALYDEIKSLTTKPLDDNTNTAANKVAYQHLLDEFGQYYNIADGKIGDKKVPPAVKESDFESMDLKEVEPSELAALGIRPVILPNDVKGLKLPTNFGSMDDATAAKVIELVSQTNLWLAFDYRQASEDQYIIGKVTNVKKAEDNKLVSYDIDCSENYPSGEDYEPINKDKYTVTKTSGSNDWTNVTAKSSKEERKLEYNSTIEMYVGNKPFSKNK